MSDIFEEAEEGLRAEQWLSIAKKSAPIIGGVLGGALLIALSYWGYSAWQKDAMSKASVTYQKGLDAMEAKDNKTANDDFTQVSHSSTSGYKALALMQLGGLALGDNKPKDALSDFDQASQAASDQNLKDFAALRSAYIAFDAETLDQVKARLEPLAQDKRPFHALAKQALALVKIEQGDMAGARQDLQNLAITIGTPDSVKSSSQQYVLAIDSGSAKRAVEVAKMPSSANAALMPQMMPQMTPQ